MIFNFIYELFRFRLSHIWFCLINLILDVSDHYTYILFHLHIICYKIILLWFIFSVNFCFYRIFNLFFYLINIFLSTSGQGHFHITLKKHPFKFVLIISSLVQRECKNNRSGWFSFISDKENSPKVRGWRGGRNMWNK